MILIERFATFQAQWNSQVGQSKSNLCQKKNCPKCGHPKDSQMPISVAIKSIHVLVPACRETIDHFRTLTAGLGLA